MKSSNCSNHRLNSEDLWLTEVSVLPNFFRRGWKMKMPCGREIRFGFESLKQENNEFLTNGSLKRLFLIIYCRSCVKTWILLTLRKLHENCRQKREKSRNFGKLRWTSKFISNLEVNRFYRFVWVLNRQNLSRQKVKMVRKLYFPLGECKKVLPKNMWNFRIFHYIPWRSIENW